MQFFDPYLTTEMKIKFQNLSTHLQDVPIHILENQLSTPKKVVVVQVTNFI